jgi:hypothetical protein
MSFSRYGNEDSRTRSTEVTEIFQSLAIPIYAKP